MSKIEVPIKEKIMTRKRFSMAVEVMVSQHNMSYIDAATYIVEDRGLDFRGQPMLKPCAGRTFRARPTLEPRPNQPCRRGDVRARSPEASGTCHAAHAAAPDSCPGRILYIIPNQTVRFSAF